MHRCGMGWKGKVFDKYDTSGNQVIRKSTWTRLAPNELMFWGHDGGDGG